MTFMTDILIQIHLCLQNYNISTPVSSNLLHWIDYRNNYFDSVQQLLNVWFSHCIINIHIKTYTHIYYSILMLLYSILVELYIMYHCAWINVQNPARARWFAIFNIKHWYTMRTLFACDLNCCMWWIYKGEHAAY